MAYRELSHLFPDLLSPVEQVSGTAPVNYYRILKTRPHQREAIQIVAYQRAIRKLIKEMRKKSAQLLTKDQALAIGEYRNLLDARFVTRKSRLRLSHDLISVRSLLCQSGYMNHHGELVVPEQQRQDPSIPESAPVVTIVSEPVVEAVPISVQGGLLIIELLKVAEIIDSTEEQALLAQMDRDPGVPVERFILDSGYVNKAEMNSLKLAEMLLRQEKITMAQFQVAMYDERHAGIRLAESLQVRGWLPVDLTVPQKIPES